MSQRKPRPAKRDRNNLTRMRAMGVLNYASFPDIKAATRAAITWAVAAHDGGRRPLASLAALLVKPDGLDQMNTTLATRDYFTRIAPTTVDPELRELLASAQPTLLFMIHDGEEASHFTLTLAQLKEALGGK